MISVDNIQIVNRARHPEEVLDGEHANYRVAKGFVRTKLPFADHYVVASFFRPVALKERTTLVPPILRPEILQAQPRRGDHLLVYQTTENHEALVAALRGSGIECRIYGLRRELDHDEVDANLVFRPFSEAGFIDDLASARAVVAGGGFTVMGEAVYLKKPMLCVPLRNQFEQVLNARYLRHEGYGDWTEEIGDATQVRGFVDELPRFEARLAAYSQDGNARLFEVLTHLLDQAAAGLFN